MNYRAYNLNPKGFRITKTHIALIRDEDNPEFYLLELGEEGRGRKMRRIICDPVDNGDLVRLGGEVFTYKETVYGFNEIRKTDTDISRPEGWVARINTSGPYVRKADGHIRYFSLGHKKKPEIIACGLGAFGDAGRIGEWIDAVVIVPFNTILRVKPSRLSPYYLYFKKQEVINMGVKDKAMIISHLKIPFRIPWEKPGDEWERLVPPPE